MAINHYHRSLLNKSISAIIIDVVESNKLLEPIYLQVAQKTEINMVINVFYEWKKWMAQKK